MLTHVVCFKYRPDVDDATRQDHRQKLCGLAGLDGVVELKVGKDVVRSPRSYDTGLVVTFSDRQSLDRYQTHARHVPVAQFGVGLSEHIVAVDFET